MFSDADIHQAIHSERIQIYPFDPELVQPASIDVRLDKSCLLANHEFFDMWYDIDPTKPLPGDMWCKSSMPIVLNPGEFILASTVERIHLGNGVAARVEGKSSLGRLGLSIHVTAGFIDPGFWGKITLEIHNVAPWGIRLHHGMRIGQLCFFDLKSPAVHPYNGHYQGQAGATSSRANESVQ